LKWESTVACPGTKPIILMMTIEKDRNVCIRFYVFVLLLFLLFNSIKKHKVNIAKSPSMAH